MDKTEDRDRPNDEMRDLPMWAGNDFKRRRAPKARGERKSATELMKTVAAKTVGQGNMKNAEKVFSPEEIEEILLKRGDGETLTKEEHVAIERQYRKMKKQVKEMEKGNKSRIIVVPSIKDNGGFYKVFDFSALYYVYRLAERMGRSARLMPDTDRNSRMLDSASLVDIEKFIEQFKRLENPSVEMTEDGIYIFTLKKELTDEELGELRLIEETRRGKLYNTLKPKKMDAAVFNEILMVVRMVGPRVKKLERHEYYAIGERMLVNLMDLLRVYFDYTRGILDKRQAGDEIIGLIDGLFAGLAVLSEMRTWDFGIASSIGEAINRVRMVALKEMGIKES